MEDSEDSNTEIINKGSKKNVQLTVTLPPSVKRDLVNLCIEEHRTFSNMITKLVLDAMSLKVPTAHVTPIDLTIDNLRRYDSKENN